MCNLYSVTTNQAAIAALFRVVNRYVGNLAPMPGVFPDYPAPVVYKSEGEQAMTMMRWGMPPPPRAGGERAPPRHERVDTRSPTSATRHHHIGGRGSVLRTAACPGQQLR